MRLSAWPFIFLALLVWGCASDLPLIKKLRNPGGHGGGDGRATVPGLDYLIDLDKIDFELLQKGEGKSRPTVSLRSFMEQHQKQFLLLVFSSSSCHACEQEEKHLLANPPAQGAEQFAIAGVNVDSGSLRQRFLRKWQVNTKETIVQLTDEGGKNLRSVFLPSTERYIKVPFVALVYRGEKEGVVWSYTADKIPEYKTLREKINKSLDVQIGEEPDQPEEPDEPGDDNEVTAVNRLALTTQKRFSKTKLVNCQGKEVELAAYMSAGKFQVVQSAKQACDAICQQNRQVLDQLDERFSQLTLISDAANEADCSDPSFLRGSELFFSTFKTHFNGGKPIEMDEEFNPVIAEVSGPLTMIFSPTGKLVFSKEGALTSDELNAWLGGDIEAFAPGFDFTLFRKDGGNFALAPILAQKEITMLSVFGKDCGECLPKLQKWSEANQLIDQCEQSGVCQFLAMEDGQPLVRNRQPNADDWNQYYDDVLNRLREQSIKADLIMDPTPYDTTLEFPELARLYDGYLLANFPEWQSFYGTVVFDKEGKIIKAFSVFLEHDALAKWLQSYIKESQK